MMDGLPRTVAIDPSALVGSWRRFGTEGPIYQVIATVSATSDGQPTLRVRVAESGEELDYPIAKALADPHAH